MLRTVILAACFCALALSCAEARPVQRHPVGKYVLQQKRSFQEKSQHPGCSDPVMRPCDGSSAVQSRKEITRKSLRHRNFLQDPGRKEITHWNTVSRPARYIAGRLVCAVNVNAELARRGIRGTGSALAKSFLHWGRASRPVVGAVAVYRRPGGGHVAIVSRVTGGRVYVWNPSSRHRGWREVEYRRRAIAYRVAGQ